MDIIERIAENKILAAMRNGEFDNLPGRGRPLPPDGLERVPEHMRPAFIIMRNSGFIPEELELRKDIASIEDLLRKCIDPEERKNLGSRLNATQLKYNILMETRHGARLDTLYHEKIMQKFRNDPDPQAG